MSAESLASRRASAHGEEGIALITVLFAVMILSGLAILFVSTATFEVRSSGISRDSEVALHVAEAASDALIPALNNDPDGYVSTDAQGDPIVYSLPDDATEAEERAWLLSVAEAAPASDLIRLADGEGFAIRPRNTFGPMRVVYAVGWVPDRDTASRVRVLKLQFDSLRYSPNVGLLTGGNLTFGGNATITGSGGSVHSNGNVSPATGPGNFSVSQNLTAAGEMNPTVCTNGSVGGECRGGAAIRPVPHISARLAYDLRDQAAAPWFDLCPPSGTTPATVRPWSAGGPCSAPVSSALWTDAPGVPRYRGWRYAEATPGNPARWHGGGSGGVHPGVYYVHHRNVVLQNTTGSGLQAVTVIAGENKADAVGNRSGHIEINGNAQLTSALSGLTLVADRDIILGGGARIVGLVAANEQINVPGTVHIEGAAVAQDEKDTPGSMVSVSRVSGNMTIDYNGLLEVPLTGVIRITHWNEL